jgi:hypothetical protein
MSEQDVKLNRNCAIFDIDGTLSDCAWRAAKLNHKDYGKNTSEQWAEFFAGIPHDKPIMPVVDLLRQIRHGQRSIVLCTGRSENNRAATMAWLFKYGVPYDQIYMRKQDCYRPDDIVKSELLDQILADGWIPQIVFEDRQHVVDMWRARGLVCAQVAKGDY